MLRRVIKVILLVGLIIFCGTLGSKVLKLEKEREGKVQVVFKYDNFVKELWVIPGTSITLEKLPEQDENYGYSGWFEVSKRNVKKYAYENFIATENVILEPGNYYLTMKDDLYTMKVKFDNGMPDIEYKYDMYGTNNHVRLPLTPIKEGYEFAGWINTKTNEEVTTETPIESISIKATWNKID